MATQRFHIGKNGPAPCNAHPELPNGRACRFGEDRHGSESEMIELWEIEQEAEHEGFLGGSSRSAVSGHDRSWMQNFLADFAHYTCSSEDGEEYTEEDVEVAMRLASEPVSDLAATRVKDRDMEWFGGSSTSVQRYELMDSTIGYFKSFKENSRQSEFEFRAFGTSTLGAAINEVNAYRMAKLFGSGYDELVPRTVFREVDGEIGSFQEEVHEGSELDRNFHRRPKLRQDYRAAAIFDFVIGNLDRHDGNYIYGTESNEDGSVSTRIRLIDNAYSFPDFASKAIVNDSIFADNDTTEGDFEIGEDGEDEEYKGYKIPQSERRLTGDEISRLRTVRAGIEEWMDEGSIAQERGTAAIGRIDHLVKRGSLASLRRYLDKLNYAI